MKALLLFVWMPFITVAFAFQPSPRCKSTIGRRDPFQQRNGLRRSSSGVMMPVKAAVEDPTQVLASMDHFSSLLTSMSIEQLPDSQTSMSLLFQLLYWTSFFLIALVFYIELSIGQIAATIKRENAETNREIKRENVETNREIKRENAETNREIKRENAETNREIVDLYIDAIKRHNEIYSELSGLDLKIFKLDARVSELDARFDATNSKIDDLAQVIKDRLDS